MSSSHDHPSSSAIGGNPSSVTPSLIATSEEIDQPTVTSILPLCWSFENDWAILAPSSKGDRGRFAQKFCSVIKTSDLDIVRKKCFWQELSEILVPRETDKIDTPRLGYSNVYTYPFTLGLIQP